MADTGQPVTREDLEAFEARIREYIASTVRTAILESKHLHTIETAPFDDEPDTEEERAAVADARNDPRPDVPFAEVKRRLGI
jgi:hypothetical protein